MDLAMLCNWYVMAGNHRFSWCILPTAWTPRLIPPHVPSFVSILQGLWRLNSLDWTVGADCWDLAMLCNWYVHAWKSLVLMAYLANGMDAKANSTSCAFLCVDWSISADRWDLAMLCNWYVMAGNHRL